MRGREARAPLPRPLGAARPPSPLGPTPRNLSRQRPLTRAPRVTVRCSRPSAATGAAPLRLRQGLDLVEAASAGR